MSKQLLQEYFQLCPDGICDLNVLTEDEKRKVDDGSVYLVGVIQKAGTKNGNGRVYRRETLQREMGNYQKAISERRALGELDHPDDSVVNLKNSSHLVSKTWWDGDSVMGKIEVLDTPSGKVLKALLKSGVKLGISSRGLGSVSEGTGGTIMVEDDFQLICFDIVSEPSTPGAYLNREGEGRSRIAMSLSENKQGMTKIQKVNQILDDLLGD